MCFSFVAIFLHIIKLNVPSDVRCLREKEIWNLGPRAYCNKLIFILNKCRVYENKSEYFVLQQYFTCIDKL